jgi:hypothetical protein
MITNITTYKVEVTKPNHTLVHRLDRCNDWPKFLDEVEAFQAKELRHIPYGESDATIVTWCDTEDRALKLEAALRTLLQKYWDSTQPDPNPEPPSLRDQFHNVGYGSLAEVVGPLQCALDNLGKGFTTWALDNADTIWDLHFGPMLDRLELAYRSSIPPSEAHNPGECLECGSGSLSGCSWNLEGDKASQEVFCNDCGHEWTDVYTFSGRTGV